MPGAAAPKEIAAAAAALYESVDGIEVAYSHDEEQLRGLPAVTLSLNRTAPSGREYTGGIQEMRWSWIVRLYLPFGGVVQGSDWEAVEDLQYDLIPKLYDATRRNRDLGGLVSRIDLDDLGEEPDSTDADTTSRVVKLLQLIAYTEAI